MSAPAFHEAVPRDRRPQEPVSRLRRYLERPDVRKAPLHLLGRRFRFELERRLWSGRLDVDRRGRFDGDLTMSLRLSDIVERSIYLYGYHDFAAASVFSGLVRPGMTVVDAGAHVGQFTLLAAKRAGPAGRVLSFEPQPDVRARLMGNVARNGFSNVTVLPNALSDEEGPSWLCFEQGASSNSGTPSLRPLGEPAAKVAVTASRLDSVLEGLGIESLDIVKIDVERLEPEVLRGASSTLARCHPAILFEANTLPGAAGRPTYPAIELLTAFGYGIHGIVIDSAGDWRLAGLREGEDPQTYREPWRSLNLVALHPDREAPFAPQEATARQARRPPFVAGGRQSPGAPS